MFNQKEQKALLFLIFLIIAGISIIILRDYRAEPSFEISKGKQTVEILIYGEVLHPGIYKFLKDESIEHILKIAGPVQGVCGKLIFAVLNPEESVNVPMNLNIASRYEFESLPSVGPALALNIVEYREKHGGFKKKEEIMKVKGIGIKKFQLISDSIFVSEKKAGKIPDSLELEFKGVKKEGQYNIKSSADISYILSLANCRHSAESRPSADSRPSGRGRGSAGGSAKEMNSRFLKLEVR